MKFCPAVVIAEYNPFHNGHFYHIERTKSEFGATHVVAVMSGNFVQRGECACVSKWVRAKMALDGGADLVIELPLPWAMSTAERFAQGGLYLADALGCAELLSFGSECGDTSLISRAAQAADSPEVTELMRQKLAEGMSFACARQLAVCSLLGESIAGVLSSPNDTLGVEYCRAISRIGSSLRPVCIRRIGDAHDAESGGGVFASAMRIRSMLASGENPGGIMPEKCARAIAEAAADGDAPADMARLESAMLYRLRTMTPEDFALLPDISEGLENRIYSCVRQAKSIPELIDAIKSKRYTHARIRRILTGALLGLRRSHGEGNPPYIRILAMNSRGKEILSAAKPSLPVVSRAADFSKLSEKANELFKIEQLAGDIFALATPNTGGCGSESRHGIIVV